MKKSIKLLLLCTICNVSVLTTSISITLAAENAKNISVSEKISKITSEIDNIKNKDINNSNYDIEKAVEALYKEIQEVKTTKDSQEVEKDITIQKLEYELEQEKNKNKQYLNDEKKQLKEYLDEIRQKNYDDVLENKNVPTVEYSRPVEPTQNYMVNPMPASRVNNYIQDAANAQGYARMEFAYAPQQVYKIYCKIGYLTDLEFKPGEKITYVGGGDTAQWMIDKAIVANTAHLYVKPITNNIATNIIVNTSGGHVYQILLNSGSWYNPMISWNYGNEDIINNKLINNEYNDDDTYPIGKGLNVQPENINFSYKIKAKKGTLPDWSPVSVFDDGKKTYIKFKDELTKVPALFLKEKKSKNLIFANYRQKNNMFIIDKVFEIAQLQISNQDKDIIIIEKE